MPSAGDRGDATTCRRLQQLAAHGVVLTSTCAGASPVASIRDCMTHVQARTGGTGRVTYYSMTESPEDALDIPVRKESCALHSFNGVLGRVPEDVVAKLEDICARHADQGPR